ncbi:MAG: peptide chain release factor 2 [Acidobacteriota bacterium]
MDEDLSNLHDSLSRRVDELRGIFDLPTLEARLRKVDAEMGKPGFWDDAERVREITRERQRLTGAIDRARGLERASGDARALRELLEEGEDAQADFQTALRDLDRMVRDLELSTLLSGESDSANAILTIHAGAGGTESMDWAGMLLRMYLRWCESRRYVSRTLDLQPGEEAGIKSATVSVEGNLAYGYLKVESGVHRLVRISPYDAASRRHTSFASVSVVPEVEDDAQISIEEKDLRIDTYRSSGAGGQHVNVTDSAVRITHLPTGIVVSCQNERSQHKNRAMAMKVLRARLAERERQERQAKQQALEAQKKEIAFGSQIRSYVLQPYRLVKDHRTGLEIGDVDRVLDGGLDGLIEAELLNRRGRPGESEMPKPSSQRPGKKR